MELNGHSSFITSKSEEGTRVVSPVFHWREVLIANRVRRCVDLPVDLDVVGIIKIFAPVGSQTAIITLQPVRFMAVLLITTELHFPLRIAKM